MWRRVLRYLDSLSALGSSSASKRGFRHLLHGGDWSTNGLSFFVGLVTAMDAFPGLDAADHTGKGALWEEMTS